MKNGSLSIQQTMVCDTRARKFGWTLLSTTSPKTTSSSTIDSGISEIKFLHFFQSSFNKKKVCVLLQYCKKRLNIEFYLSTRSIFKKIFGRSQSC
jgi:hypothetical protein